MEQMIVMTPDGRIPPSRPVALRDAAAVYETVAWRAPTATRFDGRPANDFLARAELIAPRTVILSGEAAEVEEIPRWVVVAIGAVVAALLGALVGGALSL